MENQDFGIENFDNKIKEEQIPDQYYSSPYQWVEKEVPYRFLNRELSWLGFNQRVLEEAQNKEHPLLERVRFLSISATNLDEFFMVRVAGLKGQENEGIEIISHDGLTPSKQLKAISITVDQLVVTQQHIFTQLKQELSDVDINIIHPNDLDQAQLKWLRARFTANIFPVLTPMAIDPGHPFPFISNKGFSLALDLYHEAKAEQLFALVPIPSQMDRFVEIPQNISTSDQVNTGNAKKFIKLEDVILAHMDLLFPGHKLNGYGTCRIIRDSDLEIEEEAEDLVRVFETALLRRKRGSVIRLEMSEDTPIAVAEFLKDAFEVSYKEISIAESMLALGDLNELVNVDRPELCFDPYQPRFPERIKENGGDCFAAIRQKDLIVHHPYESFDVVLSYLEQAANDPNVVAIKQTFYRTSNNSPIVAALIAAAESGKSVTAIVELKARFDEEANIKWARDLERAGVQVVYGFVDLKTHAKLSMVVRKEGVGLTTYCHIGTGNYHPITARIYTDLSLFTCHEGIARDVARVFNYVTGYAEPEGLEILKLSPRSLRSSIIEQIDHEINIVKSGGKGEIWFKMNSLVDPDIIDALYKASQAGVKSTLIVRGICCLRPGIKGLSENIIVKSVVGRFLEHPRIYCFGNGAGLPNSNAKLWIGSADLMPRNLDRRVETLVPILNPTVHSQVLDQVMAANILDNQQSWHMDAEGNFERQKTAAENEKFNLHHYFMRSPSLSGRGNAFKSDVPKSFVKRFKKLFEKKWRSK